MQRLHTAIVSTYVDLAHEPQLPEKQARKTVLRALLITTTIVMGLLLVLLVISYTAAGNRYIFPRVVSGLVAFLSLLAANVLFYKRRYYLTSVILVTLYMITSVAAIWEWGINVPFALLMMSITIILGGILLGAQYALYTAAILSFSMFSIELLNSMGIYYPDVSWQVGAQPKLGEAIGYSLLLVVLALVSWLFGRQIEQSLHHAREAEIALIDEKKLLAVRLKQRTEKLRAAQLKEMQQLYRFAELGQLSAALLHELANHLSVLTLDIEELSQKQSQDLSNARDSITYLDNLVDEVRQQLRGDEKPRAFNVLHNLQTVAAALREKYGRAHVKLKLTIEGKENAMYCFGDPTRFSQIMTILLNNALDATRSQGIDGKKSVVEIHLRAAKQQLAISVRDWGVGIEHSQRAKIFQSLYGTKKEGMGIGLFIARQIIETHFKGSLKLESLGQPTTFVIKVPNKVN